MAEEVVITYETLFDLLKRERDRPELQKLHETFFHDLIDYIKDKKKILEAKNDSVFAPEERRKTEKQLENIYKIVKELYEKREKKVMQLALDKSRTQSNLIDTTSLLKEEKTFFDALANLLDTYRNAILISVLNERMPFMQPLKYSQPEEEPKQPEPAKSTKLVRFMQKVPRFVGTELEEYGPFEEEDIANLPSEIAEILINKSKAEEIHEE